MLIYTMLFAMIAPDTASQAPRPAPKVVCKRFEETGSLVKRRKACHTRAGWNKLSDSTREEWSALQGTLGSTKGN